MKAAEKCQTPRCSEIAVATVELPAGAVFREPYRWDVCQRHATSAFREFKAKGVTVATWAPQ